MVALSSFLPFFAGLQLNILSIHPSIQPFVPSFSIYKAARGKEASGFWSVATEVWRQRGNAPTVFRCPHHRLMLHKSLTSLSHNVNIPRCPHLFRGHWSWSLLLWCHVWKWDGLNLEKKENTAPFFSSLFREFGSSFLLELFYTQEINEIRDNKKCGLFFSVVPVWSAW